LQTIRADSERHQVQAQGRSVKNDRAAPPADRLDHSAVTPCADGARQQRTAVRIPRRFSSGGGQPGTATSERYDIGHTTASRVARAEDAVVAAAVDEGDEGDDQFRCRGAS